MDNSSITWNHRNPGKQNREARRTAATTSTAFTSKHWAIVEITTAALAELHEPEHAHQPEPGYGPYPNTFTEPSYQQSLHEYHHSEAEPLARNSASFDFYPHSAREPTPVQTFSFFPPPPANTPVDIQSNLSKTLSVATIPDPDLNAPAQAVIRSREEENRRRRLYRAYDSRRDARTREHRRNRNTRRASPAPSNTSRRSLFDRITLPTQNNTRDSHRA